MRALIINEGNMVVYGWIKNYNYILYNLLKFLFVHESSFLENKSRGSFRNDEKLTLMRNIYGNVSLFLEKTC